jgi:hypothetical protein
MKFKIVERLDGKFDVYRKQNWYSTWEDTDSFFNELGDAMKYCEQRIKNYEEFIREKIGRKHRRVVNILESK